MRSRTASLDPVLAAAGLTRDDSASEPDKLRATRDDLSVSFWSLPAGGLLVTVQGPCVDVPEDARADWTSRGQPRAARLTRSPRVTSVTPVTACLRGGRPVLT